MARASTQHKLDRVRPPRVHVTYDVEIGDAIEIRELPFMVGVLGDFTGMPVQPLPRLRDRKFVDLNPDNFDAVLEGMNAHLSYAVDNKLSDKPDAGQLRVDLHFRSFDDFDPVNVAGQVKPLRELIELRVKLTDLLGKLQGNDRLDELLTDVVSNPDKLKRLQSELKAHQPPPVPVTGFETMLDDFRTAEVVAAAPETLSPATEIEPTAGETSEAEELPAVATVDAGGVESELAAMDETESLTGAEAPATEPERPGSTSQDSGDTEAAGETEQDSTQR